MSNVLKTFKQNAKGIF